MRNHNGSTISDPAMDGSATDPQILFNVEGQIAVVTGGGTGIGLQIATALERNGATVYIIGRRLHVLEKAASTYNKYGKIIPLQGDVTSRDSLLHVVGAIKARHGYIDLLVNNAGISRNLLPSHLPSPLDESNDVPPSIQALQDVLWNTGDPSGFAETFETNVTAVYYTTVAFLELLHLGNLRRGALPPLFTARRKMSPQSNLYRGTYPDGTVNSPADSPICSPIDGPADSPIGNSGNGTTNGAACLTTNGTIAGASNGYGNDNGSQTVNLQCHTRLPIVTSQVITISSSGSFRVDARILTISYTLAKQACTHLGRLLASLLADWNIRSNVLCPGVWPSEMTNTSSFTPDILAQNVPLGRVGTLSDMSGSILFLAGQAGAYVNGAIWLVDGGRVNCVANNYNP